MGVKDLWQILSPIMEKKSLWTLQNEVVAIDLSVWICENQQVDTHSNVNNLYLRNLFFRTSCLLLLGIKPIFVLEGKAPELKYKTMKQRHDISCKSNPNGPPKSTELGKRTRLSSLQKQCEELLKYMGIDCIYSDGEAEALCALLNSHGIVKGVITKDSDCFLYGARTVYRNFNISSNGGSFEEYNMSSIEKKLSLGRNKMIALSLLCGCDYNEKGIEGIGRESALKFLTTVTDSDVLQSLPKLEQALRRKAVLNPEFPFYKIQDEFLRRNYDVSQIVFSWKQPNLREFVLLTERKLGWSADYAIQKFLPLMSRWYLLNGEFETGLQLDHIVKKRTLRGVLSYEIKWKDFDFTVVEPSSYLKAKYEKAIVDFENRKNEAKKGRKEKPRAQKRNLNWLLDDMNNLSLLNDSGDANKFNVLDEESITISDFECSATDLLELSCIVESIVSRR